MDTSYNQPATLLRTVCAALLCALTLFSAPASAAGPEETRTSLSRAMASAGSSSGAIVVELEDGSTVYERNPDRERIPASNEKLFITAATLLQLGSGNRPDTVAQVAEPLGPDGIVPGDLYLRGNGDPTLSAAELRQLAGQLRGAGIRRIEGSVIGDESLFDRLRGGATARRVAHLLPIGALMVDRGRDGRSYQRSPATFAAARLTAALRGRGIAVAEPAGSGRTPAGATTLASVQAPTYAELAAATNVPSDNTIAEALLKAVGTAGFTRQGTTRSGAAVVRSVLSERFAITPRIADGSGLSRSNRTTPRELAGLLKGMVETDEFAAFFDSLAVMGRTGTLAGRGRSGPARDNCRGKTGTLRDVSSLAGYCTTRSGGTLVFAILMNRVSPSGGRAIQDRMVNTLARYDG